MKTPNDTESPTAPQNSGAELDCPDVTGSPFEMLGREMLNDLCQSGEGFDDMDFLERWTHRAEELGLLSKVKAVPDSEYYFFWVRNWINNGDTDRRLLAADGEIEENAKDRHD